MKKFLLSFLVVILLLFAVDYLYFQAGWLYFPHIGEISCHTKSDQEDLYIDRGQGFELFDLKGVNLGLGKPGKFATDFAPSEEEYLRWFRQIQDMGANVIRTYTIAHPEFYKAFYDYNVNNPDPLYLIHGVWVHDYLINSAYSAFDEGFYKPFLDECRDTVDVIHGRHKRRNGQTIFPAAYLRDISPWVYGYILGIEWEGDIVVFTNDCIPQAKQYRGEYLQTEDARNFEIFLAGIGDKTIEYETKKYGTQRVVAFANWPTTCPLDFPEKMKQKNKKYGKVDVDHIHPTQQFVGGTFASYHIYPYYPEYVLLEEGGDKIENTYLEYLKRLNEHHHVPVVVAEFGVPASRGMASYEHNRALGRDQGHMSETQQGNALVSLYKDIMNAGGAGGIAFIWQDEWFKRTWNTIPTVDLQNIVYWSDVQTNEQRFGLLSFEPGKEKRNCIIDGDASEWTEKDKVFSSEGYEVSMKYDLEGFYFLIQKPGMNFAQEHFYMPVDLTPKSGATHSRNLNISCSDPCDFIIELDGRDNSRVWVQSRYNTIAALYGPQLKHYFNPLVNPPAKNSQEFYPIHLILHELKYYHKEQEIPFRQFDYNNLRDCYTLTETYETGKLQYGNGNPDAVTYNSLTDICAGKDFLEMRIPWQLLNFADPAHMMIHDDYYEKFGVEYLHIDDMKIGIGTGKGTIPMTTIPLKPLGRKPVYHERLKRSYYILQNYWKSIP